MTGLPRFEIARRVRPVALVQPGSRRVEDADPAPGSERPCPRPAPYAAAVVDLAEDGPATVAWTSGDDVLEAVSDGRKVGLRVHVDGRTTEHRSRRHGRLEPGTSGLALTLTGTHLTVFARTAGRPWTARGRVDLSERLDTRDEAWCTGLRVGQSGAAAAVRAGGFGQLGLRDLRVVTNADGSPYAPGGRILLTATSAGPGFFDTAHASVWELDPGHLGLQHCADLYFRRQGRPGQVYGDHALHLIRADEEWLVATSTWGDFDSRRTGARVTAALGRSDADLLTGEHVIDTESLPLPTTGFTSVGVWDPHLVRTDDGWLAGYVSARRYFDFHPVVATGPTLDALELRAAATDRRATEGTTLHRTSHDGRAGWLVLASDGRDNPRTHREQYPVFDLDLRQLGTLDAPYPTNIPWPSVVSHSAGELLVGFNGAPYGGKLLGYGTHGAVVIARAGRPM